MVPSMPIRSRRFTYARRWSNRESRKRAPLFGGSVVNVSGWQDSDKQGKKYKDYFSDASSYDITNYPPAYAGIRGRKGRLLSI
jgi:hypothetical protein